MVAINKGLRASSRNRPCGLWRESAMTANALQIGTATPMSMAIKAVPASAPRRLANASAM